MCASVFSTWGSFCHRGHRDLRVFYHEILGVLCGLCGRRNYHHNFVTLFTGVFTNNTFASTGIMSAKDHTEQFLLFRSAGEPCPYLPHREWITHVFQTESIAPGVYETLLNQGFRRSGTLFYQNHCPGCQECHSIRVDVRNFAPSRSQRRVLKKNRDVETRVSPDVFHEEDLRLYRAYCAARHPSHGLPDREDYERFLVRSPLTTKIMRYTLGGRQVGLGWIDVLPQSLSSVYFSFDPQYASRSLGTFSILQQIMLCRALDKPWLQLGFWVRDCRKMNYKNNFRPCHILVDGQWQMAPTP